MEKDYFISYNKADRKWAEWLAWEIESKGFTTILQAWDFTPGVNFVSLMNKATVVSKKTIAVLSPDYLSSDFTRPEWAAAFANDPTGEKGLLLPIRIRDCEVEGLLKQIVYIDLVGKSELQAKEILDGFLYHTGRLKPSLQPKPDFTTSPFVSHSKVYPGLDLPGKTYRRVIANVILCILILISVAVSIVSFKFLPAPLSDLFGRPVPLLVTFISLLPLLSIILFEVTPLIIKTQRKKRLISIGIHGKLIKPGYFRIQPYGSAPSDIVAYRRPDNADIIVTEWLKTNKNSLLFLSGRSGSGKTSLLNASVLPELGKNNFQVLVIRSFFNPLYVLRTELLQLTNSDALLEGYDTFNLLQKVCAEIYPKKLLLVFDQLEELLIIRDIEKEMINEVVLFFEMVAKYPGSNVKAILVVRSDYIGKLQELKLPPMQEDVNWQEISPFTLSDSKIYFKESGITIKDSLLNKILDQAMSIEETKGLIRPVTLNMIGLVVSRYILSNSRFITKHKGIAGVLVHYVQSTIEEPEIRSYSYGILKQMITSVGTKKPVLLSELSGELALNPAVIKGTLLLLSNKGIVRPIDGGDKIWEISHDFIARLLSYVLSNWKRRIYDITKPFMTPVFLILFLLSAGFIVFRNKADTRTIVLQSLYNRGAYLQTYPGGVKVTFPSSAKNLAGILDSLRYINNLVSLDLSETMVTDSNLLYIGKLKKLEELNLNTTNITDRGVKFLSRLANLYNLYLGDTKTTNNSIPLLASLRNLRSLELDNLGLIDSGLDELSNLSELESLSLTENPISTVGLSFISKLTKLQKLFIDGTNADEGVLKHLVGLKALYHLDIEQIKIADWRNFKYLSDVASLKALYLSRTEITDSCLFFLGNLPNLSELYIASTNITDSGIWHLRHLPKLNHLVIQSTKITGKAFREFTNLETLHDLWARDTKLNDSALYYLKPALNLEILAVPITDVTDNGIKFICNFSELKELYFGGTKISDKGLSQLSGLPKLKKIYFPSNEMITDKSIPYLLRLTTLKEISLDQTKISVGGIKELKDKLPGLIISGE